MKKKILFLILLSFGLLPANFVMADGGMIPYYQGEDKDIYEPSQTSLITHSDGKEDLYLKVNYEGETNKFVWVIPTPSFPKASKAPKDIFEELSVVTNEKLQPWGNADSFNGSKALANIDVIVHSQEQIGIYKITVLSATGANGLFDWLNNNGYKVNQEIKQVLDWYVGKKWYFTAVKINPQEKIVVAVEEFKKFDDTVNNDNFLEKFSDYYINSLKFSNYQKALNFFEVLKIISSESEKSSPSQIEFLNTIESEGMKNYTDEKWAEYKKEIKDSLSKIISDSASNPDTITKYDNYIEPIKISFAVNTIVYPLKISQISTKVPQNSGESIKTNEILLYVLSDKQVTAPGFSNEYAQTVNVAKLTEITEHINSIDLNSLKEIIGDKTYNLTKLRRDFSKVEMDEDVYLIDGDSYKPITGETTESLMAYYKGNQDYLKAKNKVLGSALADRLKGKIVIKIEDGGKAYYINPTTKYYYYLGRPNDAFNVMKEQAVGTTDTDLSKIQIGLADLSGTDTDSDGLSDIFEDAIKTNKNKSDSDNDGYNDKKEVESGYNPNGSGKLNYNNNFSNYQKGRILLQVEHKGEAWYINPADGKRYFLGRPQDAFTIMKNLGLGITNNDFSNL